MRFSSLEIYHRIDRIISNFDFILRYDIMIEEKIKPLKIDPRDKINLKLRKD